MHRGDSFKKKGEPVREVRMRATRYACTRCLERGGCTNTKRWKYRSRVFYKVAINGGGKMMGFLWIRGRGVAHTGPLIIGKRKMWKMGKKSVWERRVLLVHAAGSPSALPVPTMTSSSGKNAYALPFTGETYSRPPEKDVCFITHRPTGISDEPRRDHCQRGTRSLALLKKKGKGRRFFL